MLRKNDSKENVLVLDASTKASIPVIESCTAMGLNVIAGSDKRYCCGFYCRGTRERIIYPSPTSEPEQCLNFLTSFLKENEISVMFPLGHYMTDFIAKNQGEFKKYTRFILPPYETFIQGLDKIPTLKAAIIAGCPIPKSWFPQEQPLSEIAKEVEYPVLIKPAISVGARGLTYCDSPEQLIEKFPKVEARYGRSFIQEFIPQDGMQYKTAFILDHSQELLAAIVYAKLRYYPVNGGSSTLNKSVHRPDILESGYKVARKLKWIGPCDCDFITDPRDNVPKLMEINPRLSDTYKMTVITGMDWTKIIYQMAKGEKPEPQLEYQKDKYLRFLFGDCMWFLKAGKKRWKAEPSFFSFIRPDTTYLMTGKHDLGPVLGYILENTSLLWDKEAREFRLRTHNV